MAIPENISKEHLLKAIEKIDKDGIPRDGDSQYYDVIYNGIKYPPKVIVSYANIFANGYELDRKTFSGGLGTQCFKLLEENDFIIQNKFKSDNMAPKIWIEKTLVSNREDRLNGEFALGKALWSPRKDRKGKDIYAKMRDVSVDDIVIHLTDNKAITGISKVMSTYSEEIMKANTEWDGDIYRINLKDFVHLKPIERDLVLSEKNKRILFEIKDKYNVFYNSELNLNQGAYLTECPLELALLINKVYFSQNSEYLPYLPKPDSQALQIENFKYSSFYRAAIDVGYFLNKKLSARFIASLLTKPFVILTGLSGSGKTKLAQAFAMWICEADDQYCIVPVGADWTNREPLFGFPNALEQEKYIKPDNGVLDLIIEANKNESKPYFLILDEMNLSHVERYFADFLSVMESKNKIALHAGNSDWSDVPAVIGFPKNLFIIGTVNIDETTYMFSPKVLDRASVIEFRVTATEMENYLASNSQINLDDLKGQGKNMAESFVNLAKDGSLKAVDSEKLNNTLMSFFAELKKTGAEFGYRSAFEIIRFAAVANNLDAEWKQDEIADAAIMQKLLPKVHGSRRKLEPVLKTLGALCLRAGEKMDDYISMSEIDFTDYAKIKYPVSLEKILRMYQALVSNGFTSYAEA